MHLRRLRESVGGTDSWFARSLESIPKPELVSLLRSRLMLSQILSTIPKDTVSPDGSLTETETTRKARIFKWPPMYSKLNSEKTLKGCTKSDVIRVSDTSGDLRWEDNVLNQRGVSEELWVWRERKSDLKQNKYISNINNWYW